MKITSITLWDVPLTSHATYYMAGGKSCDTVNSIILCLETDANLKGWGEVCPIPHYLPAYSNGVAPAVEEMAPVLLGSDPVGPEALMHRLDSHLKGHGYAKSAVDTALWDLTGKAANLPLFALLGGLHSDVLPLYHSITCVAPDEMSRIAKEAHREGIRQFQVKLGADGDWRTDVERLVKVREAVGTGPLVYGDWNCGATQLEATRVGRAVSRFDIMLEQPCATLEECASVKQATGLPMKIDENVHDVPSLLRASELGCLDAAALKLSKFGGLGAMRQSRDLCVRLGVSMCIEDVWGSDITAAAAIHLAAATPSRLVLNVCDLSGYVSPRLDKSAPVREGGYIRVADKPGHGVNPDAGVLGTPIARMD